MRLDGKARFDQFHRSVRLPFGRVHRELFAPDQSCLLALVDDGLKEATEELDARALMNRRETRMVGQRLIQMVANVPTHAEPVSSKLHQESF